VNLQALREETREQHEATEAMLPLTGPGLDRARYQQILQCFYGVVQGWETWAAAAAPARLAGLVQERRRAPLLLRDLLFFGLSPLPADRDEGVASLQDVVDGEDSDSAAYEAGFLGAMYVMEGSTLGGQYIARHVEDVFGLAPGQGDAYFRGYGEQTGSMWNAFREVLGAVPDEHSARVIAAARKTFAYVQETMRCCPAVLRAAGNSGAQPGASPQPAA